MKLILYDLGDRQNRPISPYCWRIRESLHLLSLPFEHRTLRLTQIADHFGGTHKTVPVLYDGEFSISDSWAIATYLSSYHDPGGRLFGGSQGGGHTMFVSNWVDATVIGQVNRMIVKDLLDVFHPGDQPYLRRHEERQIGQTLEAAHAQREQRRHAFQMSLHPARRAIKQRPYLGGDAPTYADFTLHSVFQWARAVSQFELLRTDDRLHDWISRMDDWLTGEPEIQNY